MSDNQSLPSPPHTSVQQALEPGIPHAFPAHPPPSLPQELALIPLPAPPAYSLISSTLAVFSSLCMEWMSRYFLS